MKALMYPFKYMNVGDSFFVAAITPKLRRRVSTAAGIYKMKHPGWNYTCRVDTENGEEGIRVWCLSLQRIPVAWRITAEYEADPANDYPGGWDDWKSEVTLKSPDEVLADFKTLCQPRPNRFRLYISDVCVAETDGKGKVTVYAPTLPSNAKQPEQRPLTILAKPASPSNQGRTS
jgi:hypothetical protein